MSSETMHRRHVLSAIAAVVVVVLAVAGYLIGSRIESLQYREKRAELPENFSLTPTIEVNGQIWAQRPNITPILLIGYDKTDGSTRTGYRSGGQSDFLLLLVIDHEANTVRQLQIDRDTMAAVSVLGVTGHPAGTRTMQICLSHAFGKTIEQNDASTLEAVTNLLEGVPVEYTISMNITSIGRMNRLLGGVTVTIQDDFSAVDPAMVPGRTLKLTDEQAETFVRSRMQIADGTNEARMMRQKTYMLAAMDLMMNRLREDSGYANTLLNGITEFTNTNMTRGRMLNEMKSASGYEIRPVEYIEGEHVERGGFMQFDANEESIIRWVLDAFYQPLKS